jgi:hypothetical protein
VVAALGALLLLMAGAAQAAYSFASFGNNLSGTFGAGFNYPFSIVVWTKLTGAQWAETVDNYAVSLSDDTADLNNSAYVACCVGTADEMTAAARDTAGGVSLAEKAVADGTYDDTWVLVVGVYTSATSRAIYIETSASPGTSATSRTFSNSLDEIRIGTTATGANPYPGLVSHVAIFDVALTTQNVDDLQTAAQTGVPPCSVDATDCIGYWPLTVDQSTHADQSGNGGPTLTVNSATYSSDAPTIISSSAPKRRRHP